MGKKVLVTLLAAAVALTAAACGQAGDTGSSAGSASAEGAAQSTAQNAAAGTIEIEYWYGLGGNLGEAMDEIVKRFNESQTKVHVTGVKQPGYGDTAKMLQAAIAADQVPGCALLTPSDVRIFAQKGLLEVLDDHIAAAPDFDLADIMPAFAQRAQDTEGRMVSAPTFGTTHIMYYRRDAFEKNNIDPEWAFASWENLAEAAAQMTVKEGGETVFYGFEPMWNNDNLVDSVCSRGGAILSEDERTAMVTTPEWVETWDAFRKWIHEDKTMRIHFGGEGWEYWYKTIDDVMQGRAAGYTGSSGDQGDLDFTVVAPIPQPAWEGHDPKPFADCMLTAIPEKGSKEQKQAAFQFLCHLISAENTGYFSMNSGFIPVRQSSVEQPEFKAYLEENPHAKVPIEQAGWARMKLVDFTGGKIYQALDDAADLVEIENVPAAEALAQAQTTIQAALDEYWAGQDLNN